MSTERDTDRLLRQWLDEGPNRAADRVVETVEVRIERQRQRPVWRLSWRDIFMNRTIGSFAAGMAVVAVALIGFNVVTGARAPGTAAGVPTASGSLPPSTPPVAATPEASPTAPASPGPQPTGMAWWLTGDLPDGWDLDGQTIAHEGGVFVEVLENRSIMADDCVEGPAAGVGSAAIDLAQALSGREGLVVSGMRSDSVGGLDGLQLDLKLADDWTGTCPWWDNGNSPVVPAFGAFDAKNYWLYTAIAPGEPVRMRLLDAPQGGNVVIAFWAPSTELFDANVDDAESILDLIRFDAGS
jgi:hypothetical protein